MSLWIWVSTILVSATVAIWAESHRHKALLWVAKPLTTALVLALALAGGSAPSSCYRVGVALGLSFSFTGDVLLLWRRRGFAPGLGSFLLVHIAYLVAFSYGVSLAAGLYALLALTLLLMVGLPRLWPHLGRMRYPVLVYALAIAAMVWRAVARWDATGVGVTALVGAVLFLISDAALAVDRFAWPIRYRSFLVLGTYWAAQCLIALSLWRLR